MEVLWPDNRAALQFITGDVYVQYLRIVQTIAFIAPVVKHWLKWDIDASF